MERLPAITLKPSRFAYYLHLVVLLLALSALLLCGITWLIKVFLGLSLLVVGIWLLKTQNQLIIEEIGFEQEHWWAVIKGNKIKVSLFGEQLVLPWLVVINLRAVDTNQKYSLALWRDAVDKEDLRRLRVFLRYY